LGACVTSARSSRLYKTITQRPIVSPNIARSRST
jgi:hypothetical protein